MVTSFGTKLANVAYNVAYPTSVLALQFQNGMEDHSGDVKMAMIRPTTLVERC